MKFLNKLIGGNVLLKVTSMNSLSVVVQIVSGFIISKMLALFVGPQGIALVGNLRNFLGASQQLGILGMYNGLIKYTAEFKENKPELQKLFSTSFFIGATFTLVLAVLIYLNADFINAKVFEDEFYPQIIKALAIALPFYSLNYFCLGIINGFSKYKSFVTINVVSNILGMFITVVLIWQQQITGALYAVVIVPAVNVLVTLIFMNRQKSFLSYFSLGNLSANYVKKLSSFAVMKLVSALLLPVVMIAIRTEIADVESTAQAGYWEAMNRISNYYMMFFTTLMTLYILPKLASTDSKADFRKEILNFYKTVLPIFAVGMFLIYILKFYVIKIVLTSEFLPMQSLFIWQLLGDLFKIMSVVIAYQLLAKNMFWPFIITELLSIGIIYASSMYFIQDYGFVGASMAHFFSYICYFLVVLFVFRKALFNVKV